MRYHYWQFLVNQEGQPINDANISVFLANSDTPANIYLGETTTEYSNTVPQIKTNSVGYFEFWIGDDEEEHGNPTDQKYKIKWEREGIVYGEIDYIDIFPKQEPVDETDNLSTIRNKTISNRLANYWEGHRTHNVILDGYPIHGISFVDLNSSNTTINKLVSDYIAKSWEDHKNFTFTESTSAESVDNAHNLQPVNIDDDDPTFNKLVSNKLINKLTYRIVPFEINSWGIENEDTYSVILSHDLNDEYPSIFCWDINTHKQIIPTEIETIDENSLKIIVSDNTLKLNVKVIAN
jgi:hypothetical protein